MSALASSLTTMTPVLCCRDVVVGYRSRRSRRVILEGVNVSLRAGELVCLLGANGIGKSSLLRTVVGLQPALAGAIELAGTALTAFTPSELGRTVGVVLTERVLVDALPARRIVELGRYAHSGWLGRLTDRDREVVEWAIDAVGAGNLADRDFSRMSDGERQRVMIARALAQEPVLLVLDEPTAFLDVASRAELWGLLRRLTALRRLAVVASTHDLDLALRTADTVWLVMPDGTVVTGTPEETIASGALDAAFAPRNISFDRPQPGFGFVENYATRKGQTA